MSDESWWSGVAHRDDEVSLGDQPGTPAPADRPDEPSLFEPPAGVHRHLAPTVEQPAVDRLTVEHPPVEAPADEPATEQYAYVADPATEQYVAEPWAQGPPAPAPVVLDAGPAVELLPPAPPPPSTPPSTLPSTLPSTPPSTDVPALDLPAYEPAPAAVEDDDVPFWLLPAPPRPGAPAPTGAVPVAPAPAPFPDVPVPPLAGNGPANGLSPSTPSAPPPAQSRAAARGVAVSRREAGRGGPAVSVGAASDGLAARASELLERGTAALGPLGARIRATHPVILGAAAAFVLGLLVVLVSLVTLGGGGDEPTATRTSTRPSASASLVPVDRSTVTASASSVQAAEGKTTYTAANTLDGKPETAWNSNGRKDGAGPGITLTYTFENLVDLRSITVRNGYIKTVEGKSGTQDLFTANARVKALKVTTDSGEFTWTLDDVKSAQSLRKSFGKTKTVTFEIVSIYKGAKYRDVALSEVSFAAAG